MKKFINSVILILLTLGANAQVYNNNPSYGYKWTRGLFDFSLIIPKGTTPTVNTNLDSTGSIWYKTGSGAGLYVHNGTTWVLVSGGGGGTPAGSNTQIQYNNSGAFGASANLTYDGSTGLSVTSAGAYNTLVINSTTNAPAEIYSFAGTPGFGIFGIPSAGQIVSNSQTLDAVFRNLYQNILIGKGAGDAVLSVGDVYVSIGNRIANASSILDITSTTKGFLKPRMTTTQQNAISTPATGLEIFNTTEGVTSFYNGTLWKLYLKGFTDGSSTGNTAIGDNAANGTLSGFNNTAGGYQALNILSSGSDNTVFGSGAGRSITTSSGNSLFSRNTGRLITGQNNSGFGTTSLYSTTTGQSNCAFGYQAMYLNDIGQYNNAFGTLSLYSNTSGRYGVAMGDQALFNNTTGWYSTGVGSSALYNVTGVSQYGVGIGYQAGMNLTTGSNCLAIGSNTNFASATADNQMNIGNIVFGTGASGSVGSPVGSVGILTASPNISSALDITSTNKGFLKPRMTKTQRDAISSPATGLEVVVTDGSYTSKYNSLNWTGETVISSASTLTLNYGVHYSFTGTTATYTLPALSSSVLGVDNAITIKNRGSGLLTVAVGVGTTIYTTSAVSSFTVAAGSSVTLVNDGTFYNVE